MVPDDDQLHRRSPRGDLLPDGGKGSAPVPGGPVPHARPQTCPGGGLQFPIRWWSATPGWPSARPRSRHLRGAGVAAQRGCTRHGHARGDQHAGIGPMAHAGIGIGHAPIVWQAHNGHRVPVIARTVGICGATVRPWLTRFNAGGLAALQDSSRAGRPPTYTPAEVGAVIAASLTDPTTLDLPFGSWTLDRLTVDLHDTQGLAMSRSRIAEILHAEGLRWRTQETWFGARVDPDFVQKRGRSSPYTRRRPPTASSSASTN
jgi:transposase